MNRICFIPARGGSKRIIGKNLSDLNGKPLLEYTIRAAVASQCFGNIVVSTDDEAVATVAKKLGVDVDKRPKNLAGDAITKDTLIFEYLKRNGIKQGIITCLLPTCPFRTDKHIKEAFSLAEKSQYEIPVISIKKYDLPIDFALQKNDSGAYCPLNISAYKNTISQSKIVSYHPNGAIFMRSVSQFLEHNTFISSNVIGYEMDEISSWDIDYPWQLEVAKHLINNEGSKNR